MVDGEPHTLEFNCFRTSVVDILRKNGGGMHASRLRYQQSNTELDGNYILFEYFNTGNSLRCFV